MALIETQDLWKTYVMGAEEIHALRGVTIGIERGEYVAIMGPSGSGKSTLMNLIGCLDTPSQGSYLLNGKQVSQMNDNELARIRNQEIGFVFQTFNLLPRATALQNVELPLVYGGVQGKDRSQRARAALEKVELTSRMGHRPNELSGGQRRRVAIARAMATKPNLLLFDDPTTGLDPVIATTVDDEIVKLRDLEQVTSIMVTHQIRDAYYIAMHEASRSNGRVQIRETEAEHARFMVLHEGRIYFEGSGAELRASQDSYLKEFLFMTLPPW